MRTAVMGVGNILQGDEGFGVHFVHHLQQLKDKGDITWLDGIEIIDGGTRGLFLINFFKDVDHLIVIDIVTGGAQVGSIYRFSLDQVKVKDHGPKISLHDQTINEVIEMARLTGIEPEVTVLGIEPKFVGSSLDLSDELRARFADVTDELSKIVCG